MDVYRYQDIQSFWFTKWQESLEDSYSLSVGNTTASATLAGYIDSEDLALAIAAILGYSVCMQTGGRRQLVRVAPACHPRIRNLYASSVRISPYALMSASRDYWRSNNSTSMPLSPIKEVSPTFFSRFMDPLALGESYNIIPVTSIYKKLKVEIDFSEFVGVVFASNDQPGFSSIFRDKEFLRYTQVTFDNNVEVLQMDNVSSLVFDAGPAKDQAFPTPIGIMLPQAKINIKWMWVPHEFICDDPLTYGKTIYNKRIQSRIGCVNQTIFLGFPPGTLLFTSWKTEPIVIPVPDAETNAVVMKLAWNINFEFSYLDTIAKDFVPDSPPWRIRGHNIFPFRNDRKFYPASIRKEDANGPGTLLYPAKDFSVIFLTKVNAYQLNDTGDDQEDD